MLIDAKGVVRALKEAYRTDGYLVAMREDLLIIAASDWYLECSSHTIPRKLLAVIAEHAGFVPRVGESIQVRKKEDVQMVLPAFVEEQIAPWKANDMQKQVWATPIMFGDLRIYQEGASHRECFGVLPQHLNLIQMDVLISCPAQVCKHARLEWVQEESRIMVQAFQPSATDPRYRLWELFQSADLQTAKPEP